MADRKQLEDALIAAHTAGDMEGAQVIADEIKNMQAMSQQAQPQQSFLQREAEFLTSPERVGRQLGLAGRYLTEGVVGLGDVLASPVRGALNLMRSPDNQIQPLAPQLTAGLPEPQTGTERVVGDISRTLAGTGATMGLAGLAQPLSQAGKAIQTALTSGAGGQARGAIGAGAGAGLAREAGLGATGQMVAGLAGGIAGAGKTATGQDIRKLQNAGRDQILKEGQQAGYVNLPSQVGAGRGARMLETVSGKFKAEELASAKNQQVTNSLARKYLGLPDDTPLTTETLDSLREQAGTVYQQAAELPAGQVGTQTSKSLATGQKTTTPIMKSGAQLIEEIKLARDDARSAWKAFNFGTDKPTQARNAAINADKRVETLEKELETLAKQNNQPQLIGALKNARQEIAKIYTVDKALNDATGSVDAKVIGKQLAKGVPISKELAIAGKYAQAFPKVNKPVSEMPNPFSIYDVIGGSYGAGAGNPLLFGLPLARVGSRYLMESPSFQQRFVQPQYTPQTVRNIPFGGLLLQGDGNE